MSGHNFNFKRILFVPSQRGVTPLHLACRHGHTQVVRLLIDHGGDVNLPSRGGVCSLHLAARCGHSNVVELLLDKGDFYASSICLLSFFSSAPGLSGNDQRSSSCMQLCY